MKKGIDVSEHKHINWDVVKPQIGFALIRLGYGNGNLDAEAQYNIRECNRLNIPYGFFWFSYASTADMASNEAHHVLSLIHTLDAHPVYPIYFDWEYDSRDFIREHRGLEISNDLLREMTDTFCGVIRANGYESGVYANEDYISSYYGRDYAKKYAESYSLWYAYYGNATDYGAQIWQYTDNGKLKGHDGGFDMNKCYKNYGTDSYKDVSKGDWYYDDVEYCAKHDLMNGVGNGEFKPNREATRAELASVVARLHRSLSK